MAEACLDSSSTPSTPKFSHRSLPSTLMMGGVGAPDYLAQALRRMNSADSVSSVGSNCVSPMNSNGLSLSVPRAIGMGSTSFVQTQSDNIFINSNNDNNNDNNNNSNNVSSNANSTNLSSTGSNMDLTNATVSWALG